MDSDGGGVAAATVTPARLTSQHSTLRESFLASDLADTHYRINTNISNSNSFSGNPRPLSSLTLGAVLNSDKKSPPPNNVVVRTLLEIIRNDETLNSGSSPNSQFANRKSWKTFTERLKIKRASLPHSSNSNQNQNANSQRWTSSSPVPQSDVLPSSRSSSSVAAMNANRNSLRNSLRNNSIRRMDPVPADDLALREVDSGGSPRSGGSFRLSAALQAEREQTRRRLSKELNRDDDEEEVAASGTNGNDDEDEDEDDESGEAEEHLDLGPPANQPVRMSLMDLLEETDRQAGISGPTYRLDDDEEEEEEEEVVEEEMEVEESGDGKGEHSCCVCMVRHKGAAFIPCGHTFCRLCSRELWVQRGNCPLCNNFILEILDIF